MRTPHAPINPLVAGLASPPIPEAQGWAARYDGRFGPLVNLSQAVPGSPPHPDLLRHLAQAAGAPETARYGAIEGDADLRGTYAAQLSTVYDGQLAPGDIAITAGCNQAFVVAMMLLAQAGDAVILPAPWYFNHQMTLAMMGIAPRALPCRPERGFVPDVSDAEALIDARTRAIVLVTPNNPTGAIYPPATIAAFAELCRRRGIWLVVDETYRDFLPADHGPPHGLFTDDAWRENVIQLYSFSKSFAVPGHRLGAMVADAAVIGEVAKILDNLQICAPRAGQAAVAWAIPELAAWRDENRDDILNRAQAFREALSPFPGWRIDSIGAYFCYLAHPFPGRPAHEVAAALAVERGVLCLPGSFFGPGQDAHLRVAFANVGLDAVRSLASRFDGFTMG